MGLNTVRQRGVSLIELIIAIVVLGIAVAGILTALGRTTLLQVDPMIRTQSLALAQSFMDEVSGKPFYDPDDDPRFESSPSPPIDPCDISDPGTPSPGNGRAELYRSVCAYHGYDAGAVEGGITAPNGQPIPGLGAYNVRLNVTSGGTPPFDEPPDNCILQIEVLVDDATGSTTRLHGYRTSSWEDCA